jgi:hypothetical protein
LYRLRKHCIVWNLVETRMSLTGSSRVSRH